MANVSYLPHGAPFYYVLGNQLWRVLGCNSRLQPVEIYDAIGNGASAFLLVQCWNWNGPNGGLSV